MELVTLHPDAWKTEEYKHKHWDEGINGSDDYPNGGIEPDHCEDNEGVIVLFSGECVPCVTGDDCNYITTHEIQLSELSDHEADYEQGSSAGFPAEEDERLCALDAPAPCDCGGGGNDPRAASARAAGVSTLNESDPRDAANFPSSDERASKSPLQCSGNGAGQIHLSIRTTSRAINDPSNVEEQENVFNHARRSGDMPRYVLREIDGKTEAAYDRAKCFIAAPGRLHFGCKLRRKDAPEYSSGTSSAVSELDDADKEVRSLTARAFKSLAEPYFHAKKFSASTESSASEQALEINRWSTLVDLKYGSVNVSQGLDQSIVSHQSSTFEIAKNNSEYKGAKAPHGALPFTKKFEPMGDFAPGQGGLIRLTKTLNFCCNVKSGVSAGERRTNFSQNAAGSRSPDEVTNSLPSSQKRVTNKQPCKSMEDTHKKAILASSLIKNVISKKMQFEQERKMERGEIREPQRAPASAAFTHQDSDSPRAARRKELHRQNSKFSECGSDHALVCVDEMEDFADGGSCDSRRRALVTDTDLDPPNEAGIVTKKGASGASKSTLLLSQNSAFRCWRDGEVEFQKDRKNDQTPGEHSHPAIEAEADRRAANESKLTKMSRLFVPSVQVLSSDGDAAQQLQSRSYSPHGDGGGIKLRSDNTLYIADSGRAATSKSPEIKINLRSVRESENDPPGVSRRLAPNLGCNAASFGRTDDFKCQALTAALKGESADRAPHFTVRDIRDNKGKLQTPIHQVRDVRKLVKSSYHFVSLDNSDNKSSFSASDGQSEQKRPPPNKQSHSVSPIVIKCQSVNTNSNEKQAGNLGLPKMGCDTDKPSPEGTEGLPPQRSAGSALVGASEESFALGMESLSVSKRQEKFPDVADKKSDPRSNPAANQLALEKLQAAVKTMEQLYVYEKNEWKRKNEPRPLTDSHVLSLIANEQHGGGGGSADKACNSCAHAEKSSPPATASHVTESLRKLGDKDGRKSAQAPNGAESKAMFSLSPSVKSYTSGTKTQLNSVKQTPFNTKLSVPKSPKVPVSLKISQSRKEVTEAKEAERFAKEFSSLPADNENYLTIPVRSHPTGGRQPPSADKTSVYSFGTQSPPGPSGTRAQADSYQTPKVSSVAMETPSPEITSATIYHSLPRAVSAGQPQFYCFPPGIAAASPSMDPFQSIQRKVLLDPSTGSYYLVDTPVQPATKRLFDPETGHYVDVPMSQTPMAPLPVSIPHLALSPGPAYMIYPSFMQTPSVIPARTLVQSQLSMQSDGSGVGEAVASQQAEPRYMDSPLYMTTGGSLGAPHLDGGARPPLGVPSVSISSQQGPRIIAPPSFDGTTMSFVVEHR